MRMPKFTIRSMMIGNATAVCLVGGAVLRYRASRFAEHAAHCAANERSPEQFVATRHTVLMCGPGPSK